MAKSRVCRTNAFTLVELMAVIAIIGVFTALAAPSIADAVGEQRTRQAALDIVRLHRELRAATTATGRAHVFLFTRDAFGAGAMGRARIFRGIAGACRLNNWAALLALPDCPPDGVTRATNSMCVDDVSMGASEYRFGAHSTRMESFSGQPFALCTQPDGHVFFQTGALAPLGPWLDDNTIQGGFRITFQRLDAASGAAEGVLRQVVIPLGGAARVMR